MFYYPHEIFCLLAILYNLLMQTGERCSFLRLDLWIIQLSTPIPPREVRAVAARVAARPRPLPCAILCAKHVKWQDVKHVKQVLLNNN